MGNHDYFVRLRWKTYYLDTLDECFLHKLMENKYAFQERGKVFIKMIRYILMKLSQDLGELNTEMGQK
jgi:hypothetical protein